ncbi:MAG: hypothetical protein J6N32_12645, partial [Clostridia bacterium]|nr:hypothetical protein [Clostridia bacterium]
PHVNGPNTLQPYSTEFFSFPLPIISAKQTGNNRLKRFWRGVWGEPFPQKGSPQEKIQPKQKGYSRKAIAR